MTYPKSEAILAAVVTRLATITGLTVYRSRADALSKRQAPAIIVEPGVATAARPGASTNRLDWSMDVQVIIHTRGAIPDQLAGPYLVQVHSLLMADRTLGGLVMDIWPQQFDPQREQADQTAGWQICTYGITYRTFIHDLTA